MIPVVNSTVPASWAPAVRVPGDPLLDVNGFIYKSASAQAVTSDKAA